MRHGFLLIDKPEGPTSHDTVAQVRRVLGERDIGHLGTLDPAASGLLVLAVGKKALKVIELFTDAPKEYEAEVRLGAVSSTYDREGVIEEVTPKPGWEIPPIEEMQRVIRDRFLGRFLQVPPAHSAVKVGGTRAYRKAQRGQSVDVPARTVLVTACDILSYAYPVVQLRIACGSGTYIRSLAHDLGQALRCGGYLRALRRTSVSEWRVESAVKPEVATWANVIPLKDVTTGFPRRDLTAEEAEEIRHGRDIEGTVTPNTIGWADGLPVALLEPLDGNTHARKVL